MLLNKKAQSTLEYAVIIAVVVAALIAMQAYFKRGVQGKIKQASDDIGEQYSPGNTTANTTITSTVKSGERVVPDADERPTTITTSNQSQSRTHSESVGSEKDEWWGGK